MGNKSSIQSAREHFDRGKNYYYTARMALLAYITAPDEATADEAIAIWCDAASRTTDKRITVMVDEILASKSEKSRLWNSAMVIQSARRKIVPAQFTQFDCH